MKNNYKTFSELTAIRLSCSPYSQMLCLDGLCRKTNSLLSHMMWKSSASHNFQICLQLLHVHTRKLIVACYYMWPMQQEMAIRKSWFKLLILMLWWWLWQWLRIYNQKMSFGWHLELEFPIPRSPWNCSRARAWKGTCTSDVPCIDRLWYCIKLCWPREEDRVGCLGCLSWADTCPAETIFCRGWHTTRGNGHNREVYYPSLWPNQHMQRNRQGTEEDVCEEAQCAVNPSNKGCLRGACEESSVSRRPCVGSDAGVHTKTIFTV